MKLLEPVKGGRPSPTGSDYFISAYGRTRFRLSRSIIKAWDFRRALVIGIADDDRDIAYLAPSLGGIKIDRDGKFSSRALHEWLGYPEHGTHYAVTLSDGTLIAEINRTEPFRRFGDADPS